MDKSCVNNGDRGLKKIETGSTSEVKSDKMRKANDDSLDSGIIKDPYYANLNSKTGINYENDSSEEQYIVDPTSKTTYLKGRFLGKGGFARVHQLLDLAANTIYAGKIIPKTQITKRQHMEKIAREILIHRDLKHHNVVRLHHFFEDTINAYIILENCSRKSLVHVLKHRLVVSEPEVRYYLKHLISGVQYIHSKRVIHRDLKPGNMLLTENMTVKVGDFGLAAHVDAGSRVTICGTPNYIAPEVLNKLSYSYEADVWAIGCIMYALLVGQPPFETATLKETYARIVSNQYTLPELASAHARSLVNQLLSPNPDDRPTLQGILDSNFFRHGYMPAQLSPMCCFTTPTFPACGSESVNCNSRVDNVPLSETDDLNTSVSQLPVSALTLSDPPTAVDRHKTPVSGRVYPSLHFLTSSPGKVPKAIAVPVATPLIRPITLKQKLSNVLCSDKFAICRNGKRLSNASVLYQNLVGCFNVMPKSRINSNPPTLKCSPLFVSKWIDYSNKYGFGFQLSDKSIGVLFNDNTRIAFTPDRSHVEFHDIYGKVTAHPHHSVPAPLSERFTLLRYFGEYMDEHLTEGGDMKSASSRHKSTVPHMKRWVRTNTAIIMELCSGTLQINFFKDHTKVIISNGKLGYIVTYINCDRQSQSYTLHSISNMGCDGFISERLRFAAAVLREFAELEGEGV